MNTRFNYDECRTKKKLQESSDPGRWILDVPGNGLSPPFLDDPHIIPQKWGANLRTNPVELESELFNIRRRVGRDCVTAACPICPNSVAAAANSAAVSYPIDRQLITDESRASCPAWWFREAEQANWAILFWNPQNNTCLPFENNAATRILEKDYFTARRDCVLQSTVDQSLLPANFMRPPNPQYQGGPSLNLY